MSNFTTSALLARQAGDIEGYIVALKAQYSLPEEDFIKLYSHHLLPDVPPPSSVDPAIRLIFQNHNYTYKSAHEYLSKVPTSSLDLPPNTSLPEILDANYFHSVRSLLPTPSSATEVLLSLFLFGLSLPSPTFKSYLSESELTLLTTSSILKSLPHSPSYVLSPYQIYPLPTFQSPPPLNPPLILLATDWSLSSLIPPKYTVMPIGLDTLELLSLTTSSSPSLSTKKEVLDLCAGSGAQGISYKILTEPTCELTMVDVNPRAVTLCRFNGSLNGVSVNVKLGSCYSPLDAHSKFNCILCNPPFVAVPPSLKTTSIYNLPSLYASGGPKGDEVLKEVLGGLKFRLTENGRFYAVTEVQNVTSSPHTIRNMLGAEGGGRVNVAYCVEDVENIGEYSVARSGESGIDVVGGGEVYEMGINGDGETVDRALVLISVGFDDEGENLYGYSKGITVEYPGDAFLESEGREFLREHLVFEKTERTVGDVGLDKQAFVEAERLKEFVCEAEAAALRSIFTDPQTRAICEGKLGARWESVLAKFESREWGGEHVRDVVERLDAPHLKPTGIIERMRGGTDSAAFGVASLVNNLQ